MAANNQTKTDDFFTLLKDDQKIANPFAADEIIIRDENGNLSVLKGGKVLGLEKEEKKFEIKSQPQDVPKQATVDFQAEVESIIKKLKIHFSDQETEKRFRNVVLSRLKGVRNQVQAREIMLDSPLAGGLGFKPEEVERILAVISKEAQSFHGRLRENVSVEPFSDLRAEVNFILEKAIAVPEKPKAVFPGLPPAAKQEPPEVLKVPPEKPQAKSFLKPIAQPLQKSSSQPAYFASAPSFRPANAAKPKIEDIKFKPKLTGPIEEIRSMTLADFRRLGAMPQESTDKILGKIEVIEEESFSKRIQAIKAWKENRVNQLYLELGNESMEEKKSISEIISERQAKGIETLTEPEVEAIIELNQKLRY